MSGKTVNPGRNRVRLVCAAVVTVVAAALIPSGVTGAFWVSSAAGNAVTPGAGDWCATSDPATNPRILRLADLPTITGVDGVTIHIAAVPVANNAAWGAGSGNRNLAVKLSSCATTLSSFDLRITAWSNPTSGGGALTWAAGTGAVAPASRLDLTQGYGIQLQRLARWGATNGGNGTTVTTEAARRFSWLVSDPRSRTNVAANPACSDRRNCTPAAGPIDGNTASIANTWVAAGNPTATFPPSYIYPARTYAENNNSATGGDWAAANGLAGTGRAAGTVTTTTLVPTTDAIAPTSVDGNQVQWVVLEWWGTTPPTADLVAEIVLAP